jgi:hypothetical protein
LVSRARARLPRLPADRQEDEAYHLLRRRRRRGVGAPREQEAREPAGVVVPEEVLVARRKGRKEEDKETVTGRRKDDAGLGPGLRLWRRVVHDVVVVLGAADDPELGVVAVLLLLILHVLAFGPTCVCSLPSPGVEAAGEGGGVSGSRGRGRRAVPADGGALRQDRGDADHVHGALHLAATVLGTAAQGASRRGGARSREETAVKRKKVVREKSVLLGGGTASSDAFFSSFPF